MRKWAAAVLGLSVALAITRPARADEITPPALKDHPAAQWPKGHADDADATVDLVVTVAADGSVTEAKVDHPGDAALDEAALEAVKRWSFAPAQKQGKAVAARIRAEVRFTAVRPPDPARVAPARPSPPAPAAVAAPAPPAASPAPVEVHVLGERQPPRSASEVVIERDVLKAAPHRTANDLLLVVPGVYITQHSGEGKAYQIFFRGFDAVHGQDIEISAGGAPVNDVSNIHGQGYADLHFLPPEVVKEIRAAPGSYDPRQGDFAVAGSIDLDLGLEEPGITAKFSYGQFATQRYFLAYRPKDASEETFAAVEVYATQGFGPSRAARRASAIGQWTHDLGADTSLRIMASAYGGRFDSAGVLRLDDIEEGRVDRFATYDPKQGGDATRAQIVVDLAQSGEGRWALTPFVIFRSMKLRSNFTGYYNDPNGDSEQEINEAITVGAKGHYRYKLGWFAPSDAVEAGISERTDFIQQSQRRLSPQDSALILDEIEAKVRASDVAGYLDLVLHPWKRVIARGGVRLDGLLYSAEDSGKGAGGQSRSAAGAHIGGKATVEVNVARGASALVSYGDGFRSPEARSLAEGEKTPFTTVRSFEGGLRYADDRVRGSVAGFYTWLSDDLAFDQSTARFERVPGTTRTGFAAEIVARPKRWLLSTTSFTYTRAVFRESQGQYVKGSLLPNVPQIVVRTDLAFTPTIARIKNRNLDARVGVGTSYLGRRPLPLAQLGHDVFLLDATANLRWKEVEIGVDAFNLLNAAWYDGEFSYASNFTQGATPSLIAERHVTVGAPRTVLFTGALYL